MHGTSSEAMRPIRVADGVEDRDPDVVDTLHDLFLRLTGDREVAARATHEVALRTAERAADGVVGGTDRLALLTAACAHARALARAGLVTPPVAALEDRLVLDLVVRRGLTGREVATATGVRERELQHRRAAGARALGLRAGRNATTIESEHADAPVVLAPASLRRSVTATLANRPTPDLPSPHRRTLAVATSVLALAGLALATPWLVDEVRSPPPVVAVATEWAPPSTDAELDGTDEGVAAVDDEPGDDVRVVLPEQTHDTDP